MVQFMNAEIGYTVKRLLAADQKVMYEGPSGEPVSFTGPNPFSDDWTVCEDDKFGGLRLSPYLTYDWWALHPSPPIFFPKSRCTTLNRFKRCTRDTSWIILYVRDGFFFCSLTGQSQVVGGEPWVCPFCAGTIDVTSALEKLQHRQVCDSSRNTSSAAEGTYYTTTFLRI